MRWIVSVILAVARGGVAASLIRYDVPLVAIVYAIVELIVAGLCVENALSARNVDQRGVGWSLPILYLVGWIVVPIGAGGVWQDAALLTALPFRIWCVWSLGVRCSAGPATFDGVCTAGPYRWVRHPMQLSGLVSRLALCAVFPHWWNWFGLGVMLAASVGIVVVEESFLRQFEPWRAYAQLVRSRLLPGVW